MRNSSKRKPSDYLPSCMNLFGSPCIFIGNKVLPQITSKLSEGLTMTIKEEFTSKIEDKLEDRIENAGMRPTIEVWPGEDDFAQWVASHKAKDRAVICNSPEYKDTPFCGRGSH